MVSHELKVYDVRDNSFMPSRIVGTRIVFSTMVTDETVDVVTRKSRFGFRSDDRLDAFSTERSKTASTLAVTLARTSPTLPTSSQVMPPGVMVRRVSLRFIFALYVFLTSCPARIRTSTYGNSRIRMSLNSTGDPSDSRQRYPVRGSQLLPPETSSPLTQSRISPLMART